ncbi:MAG: lysophospholipid acyltransferase family protein [Bdellovibrionales bacterium]|nr:lysophospholipid acyltransferase family protein [Bdellovibrionales bacterium]
MSHKLTFTDNVIAFAGALILRVVAATARWRRSGVNINGSHWSHGGPYILVFWHSDQLLAPWSYLNQEPDKSLPIYSLISQHRDGQLIAKAVSYLSIRTLYGSSTRGGARALVEMRRVLSKGCHVGITPDGPKGPPQHAKLGAVTLSSITGRPILPLGIEASQAIRFSSWDKMFLALPFSKISIVIGEPWTVAPDRSKAELEIEANKLTQALNQVKSQACQLVR